MRLGVAIPYAQAGKRRIAGPSGLRGGGVSVNEHDISHLKKPQ
jgi:hypothetical protein